MISAQNTDLPHLGADIRPAQPEHRRERKVVMRDGNWVERDMIRDRDASAGWIEFRDLEQSDAR